MIALKVISIILNLGAIVFALIGGLSFVSTMATAETVFQQIFGAAQAVVIIIIPYCISRCFADIVKIAITAEPKKNKQ